MVLDASVAAAAVLNERPLADAALSVIAQRRGRFHVPHVFDLEVMQAIRGHLRGGTLALADAERALITAGRFPLRRWAHPPLLARAWSLRDNLTVYDAVYVALAECLGIPLVTADSKLAEGSPGSVQVILIP